MINRDADTQLDVEWTKPQQTYGELKGYRLRYGIKDQQLIDVTLNPTIHQYRLTNLGENYNTKYCRLTPLVGSDRIRNQMIRKRG